MDSMRITFVLPSWALKPSGGARVVYQYASGLVGRGHDVTVVHAAFLEPWQYPHRLSLHREPKVVARGVVDIAGGRPAGPEWQEVDPAVRLEYVRTLSPAHVPDGDVVVATAWRTAESVARYPSAKGAGHYLIQHYETWDAPKWRVDHTWRAPLTKIVIAGWLADVGRELGVDTVRIANGIDHDRFRLTRPIEGRPPRVAMMWSPAPVKGGADGIAALTAAKAQEPALEAVLFGVRPRPADLPAWIDYRHNPSQSELVDDIYNASSVYLCPSLAEGWHLPPAEAMACGNALVSTSIGGVRDYARHGETALLAAIGDVDRLTEQVVRLCQHEDERSRLAHAGNRLIGAFTWERAVDSFETLLARSRTAVA